MLFGSVVDSASEEASAEESAEVLAEGAAEAAVSEAAGASVLEEQPVTRPRQSARERAGTTNFLIILPPWPVSGRINFRVAAVKNVVAVRSSYGILLKGFEKVQKKHATACLNMTFRQNADSLHLGRVQAGDGRSFLGSSQPGTRTPSQSGLRHQVIELTAAPGRSPSCCIPLTVMDCSTGEGKRQERKFLEGPPEKRWTGNTRL